MRALSLSQGQFQGTGGKGLNIPEAPLPHAMHVMYNMFRVCEKYVCMHSGRHPMC